jgi:hypothetical protein
MCADTDLNPHPFLPDPEPHPRLIIRFKPVKTDRKMWTKLNLIFFIFRTTKIFLQNQESRSGSGSASWIESWIRFRIASKKSPIHVPMESPLSSPWLVHISYFSCLIFLRLVSSTQDHLLGILSPVPETDSPMKAI